LTVNFDSNGSSDLDGYITDYTWDFGDGGSSNEANPSHVYNNVGNFTAVLTVTDDMGATAASSLSITAQGSSVGCVSDCMLVDQIAMSFKRKAKAVKAVVMSVDEYGNQVGDASVYAVWTLPDGSKIEQFGETGTRSRANFTFNAESSGTYTLTVVEMSKDGYVFDPENSNVLNGMINVGF
jgi:PKD repeat protein